MASLKKRSLLACVSALAVAGALALGGCGASGHTGGVAATVNGTDIAEDTITEYIEYFRDSNDMGDEDSWATWLNNQGMTSEDVRDTVLDFYIKRELEAQLAADQGITVEDSEIDEQVQTIRDNYSSDEDFVEALNSQGFKDEADYRDNVRVGLIEQKLSDAVLNDEDKKVSEDDVVSMLSYYAPNYDGMKRSSHILFAADDKDTAKKVLSQLRDGSLSWNDAVQKYTTDEGTKETNGDVGWNLMSSFVAEYTNALEGLDKGEMSGLVTSDYGIHIIKCTDEFNCPDKIKKASQCPDELVDQIRSYLESNAESTAYDEWYTEQEGKAEIHKNDFNNGVSYYVDLDAWNAAQERADSESADDGSGDAADGDSGDDSAVEEDASNDEATESSKDE